MTEFLVTQSGTAHILEEDSFTACGRELEGEVHELLAEDDHLCETCAATAEPPQEEQPDEEPEVADAPAADAGVEPVGRSPKSHRRHLGY